MKKIVLLLLPLICCVFVHAQKIATARNVQLVSTPGIQLVMKGGIEFNGTSAWKDSGTTTLMAGPASGIADWQDNTATGVLVNQYGSTVFNNNTSIQNIAGPTTFYTLKANGTGINLLQSNEVRNSLQLDKGLVYFTNASDSIYVSNPSTGSIASAGSFATSWVHGKLARLCNTSASAYNFPTGKIKATDSLYAPVRLQKVNNNPAIYTVVYFPATPADHLNFMNPPIDHISEQEYWQISSNLFSGTDDDARVTLTWRPYSVVGSSAATRDSLLVAHYIDNTGFRWEPEYDIIQANIVSGTASSGFVTTNINVGNFTQAQKNFTLGSRSPFNKLPLEYISWTVAAHNQTALLQWNIINDRDVLKYEIERSSSGSIFSRAGSSMGMSYAGTGAYAFTDAAPQPGWNFYRIKITDRNNRSVYTDIKKVYFGSGFEISVYPNPVQDLLQVQFSAMPAGDAGITVTDAWGRLVLSSSATETHNAINTSTWAKGMYILQVRCGGEKFTRRFIKE